MNSVSKLYREQYHVTTSTTVSYLTLTGSTGGGVTTDFVKVIFNNNDVYENNTGACTVAGHIKLSGTVKNVKLKIKPIFAEKSGVNRSIIEADTAVSLTVVSTTGASVTGTITGSGSVKTFAVDVAAASWWKPCIGIEVAFGITASATAAGSTIYYIDAYVLSQKNFR